jgi:6-phosphogluconolactonase (cycloisomerase 2 family)
VDDYQNVLPIAGPKPPYPSNAPCWVAKGLGNIWYTGNTPGKAISIFFSDGQGGMFYKSISLPDSGSPTDITVSRDGKWLAVIYTASNEGYVAVYSIDPYGDLTYVATSPSVSVAAFNGVAISQ